MASVSAALSVSIPGASQINSRDVQLNKLNSFQHPSRLTVRRKSDRSRPNLCVRAGYKYGIRTFPSNKLDSSGRGGDFLAGFILGGAVFGTLAYIYSPEVTDQIQHAELLSDVHASLFLRSGCKLLDEQLQLRKLILNEDEHGFRKLRRPIYLEYEESGLEKQKTRQVLNDKIRQLNSAIDGVSSSVMDNVSSRLKGWKGKDGIEIDSEAEAAM
ncbi:hypothetical protein ACLOJK_027326 [Asimina triloba]